jgi:hypothetical protein
MSIASHGEGVRETTAALCLEELLKVLLRVQLTWSCGDSKHSKSWPTGGSRRRHTGRSTGGRRGRVKGRSTRGQRSRPTGLSTGCH